MVVLHTDGDYAVAERVDGAFSSRLSPHHAAQYSVYNACTLGETTVKKSLLVQKMKIHGQG